MSLPESFARTFTTLSVNPANPPGGVEGGGVGRGKSERKEAILVLKL